MSQECEVVGEDAQAVADGDARQGSVACVAAGEEEGQQVAERGVGSLQSEFEAVVGLDWMLLGLVFERRGNEGAEDGNG